jgi:hypothetical protein
MMFGGKAAPSLADSPAVMSVNDVHIPATTLQTRIMLQHFLVLLHALLGGQQQLVQAYQAFHEQLLAWEPDLNKLTHQTPCITTSYLPSWWYDRSNSAYLTGFSTSLCKIT